MTLLNFILLCKMEFITTDNAEIAAKINKVIKNELLSYTCQLFLKSSDGKPEPEGSGVFVKLDKSYYIFTASHVAKHLKNVVDENDKNTIQREIVELKIHTTCTCRCQL